MQILSMIIKSKNKKTSHKQFSRDFDFLNTGIKFRVFAQNHEELTHKLSEISKALSFLQSKIDSGEIRVVSPKHLTEYVRIVYYHLKTIQEKGSLKLGHLVISNETLLQSLKPKFKKIELSTLKSILNLMRSLGLIQCETMISRYDALKYRSDRKLFVSSKADQLIPLIKTVFSWFKLKLNKAYLRVNVNYAKIKQNPGAWLMRQMSKIRLDAIHLNLKEELREKWDAIPELDFAIV